MSSIQTSNRCLPFCFAITSKPKTSPVKLPQTINAISEGFIKRLNGYKINGKLENAISFFNKATQDKPNDFKYRLIQKIFHDYAIDKPIRPMTQHDDWQELFSKLYDITQADDNLKEKPIELDIASKPMKKLTITPQQLGECLEKMNAWRYEKILCEEKYNHPNPQDAAKQFMAELKQGNEFNTIVHSANLQHFTYMNIQYNTSNENYEITQVDGIYRDDDEKKGVLKLSVNHDDFIKLLTTDSNHETGSLIDYIRGHTGHNDTPEKNLHKYTIPLEFKCEYSIKDENQEFSSLKQNINACPQISIINMFCNLVNRGKVSGEKLIS